MERPLAVFLYARVSTSEQSLSHQQTQAENAGFVFDHVIADHGVSGVTVRMRDRPEGRRLFDMLRDGDTLVVRWVDRLGRNYADVTETIREFMLRGVIIRTVINNMTFDGSTKDPMQMAVRDAMIGFMAASAQAQAEAIKEAQKAGIAEAQASEEAYLGRKPSFDMSKLEIVNDCLSKGLGVSEAAKVSGLSRQTIYRIMSDPAAAAKAVVAWETKGQRSPKRVGG
jgi:DNA invertase Pin-like site-specific DNA recombinase